MKHILDLAQGFSTMSQGKIWTAHWIDGKLARPYLSSSVEDRAYVSFLHSLLDVRSVYRDSYQRIVRQMIDEQELAKSKRHDIPVTDDIPW